MTSPLDLTGLVPTLIVVWICAFIIPLGELIIAKYRGRLPARPLLLVAQRANFLGLVSYSLYIFTVVIAVLAVGCAGLAGRLQAQAPDRTGSA
jgi:peptidoglycan/LPS O-acetylase OafA/YrhL